MEREDIIDLGTASVDTQGPVGVLQDQQLGVIVTGLADD
jgi:hypothetical protein